MLNHGWTPKVVTAVLAAAMGVMTACQPPSGPVVAATDSTPPIASLSLSHTPSGSASSGDLKLLTKSGPLYFSAVGRDPETGIQDVQIWVSVKSSFCDAESCTGDSGGLIGAPRWTSTSPKKNPGEPMSETSLLLEWVELGTALYQGRLMPGESQFTKWTAHAVVKNNLGMTTTTGDVTATFFEAG
jgi:hypothetical protein